MQHKENHANNKVKISLHNIFPEIQTLIVSYLNFEDMFSVSRVNKQLAQIVIAIAIEEKVKYREIVEFNNDRKIACNGTYANVLKKLQHMPPFAFTYTPKLTNLNAQLKRYQIGKTFCFDYENIESQLGRRAYGASVSSGILVGGIGSASIASAFIKPFGGLWCCIGSSGSFILGSGAGLLFSLAAVNIAQQCHGFFKKKVEETEAQITEINHKINNAPKRIRMNP